MIILKNPEHIYESKLKNGVKYFTKILKNYQNKIIHPQRNLFLTLEKTSHKKSGEKKKIGKLIPVQVTAKSRREYKHRGRVVGLAGRRHKDQESRKQMVVGEQSENVYHTLPKQKKMKKKQSHSLQDAVKKIHLVLKSNKLSKNKEIM